MKKQTLTLLLALACASTFAQSTKAPAASGEPMDPAQRVELVTKALGGVAVQAGMTEIFMEKCKIDSALQTRFKTTMGKYVDMLASDARLGAGARVTFEKQLASVRKELTARFEKEAPPPAQMAEMCTKLKQDAPSSLDRLEARLAEETKKTPVTPSKPASNTSKK